MTANTRADGAAYFDLAERRQLRVQAQSYAFDRADQALADLADDRFDGVAVLRVASTRRSTND